MHIVFHENYKSKTQDLKRIVSTFDSQGTEIGDQNRNTIKTFILDTETINIKSFKIPNIINQVIYKFFRKSKAQRSFEHACILLNKEIGTPQPIAYFEFPASFLFKRSFYISKHLNVDLTYRELCFDFNYPEHEIILRAFTRFTYKMHQNDIYFLDHSPGNTLIKKENNDYKFYLVDLNRMKFEKMDFETRIKNFSKLTVHKPMIKIMSDEYAKCTGEDFSRIFNLMWASTETFQKKYFRKKRLKKKLLFWRQ